CVRDGGRNNSLDVW
nr:immunoglobulin heavy chain junction region [Macaca mulatta]